MASISRTIWPFATPPIAGLQLICAITPIFMVINSTDEPKLAAAAAASQPAWPAPTTITSYLLNIVYRYFAPMAQNVPRGTFVILIYMRANAFRPLHGIAMISRLPQNYLFTCDVPR